MSRLVWRRWVGRRETGIDRVCFAYLRHFGSQAQAVIHNRRYRGILDRRTSIELFELLLDPEQDFRRRFLRLALRRLPFASADGRGRIYLNVGHTGLEHLVFRQWVERATVRPIYLIHDLIPITHPELCRAGEKERHRRRMRHVLETATGVIGNSEATIDDLRAFARHEGLGSGPQLVAPLGIAPLADSIPQSAGDGRATFVMLGTIEARKNHLFLLQLWARLVERMGSAAPILVIIGQRGWEAEQAVDWLDRSDRLRGHVIELNDCSDEQLAGHLASARALLFPSLAEGYGLPLVEALGAGIPVISSDLPVFAEIGQGVLTQINPLDGPAWEEAILDYARPDSATRSAQLSRLGSFRAPTWGDHFKLVDDWLALMGSA